MIGFAIKTIGFKQFIRTILAVSKHGYTLLALLDSVKTRHDGRGVIEDEHEKLFYEDLYVQVLQFAYYLNDRYTIQSSSKVIIICSNSVSFIKSIFAVSGLGADIFLLNTNKKEAYYRDLLTTQKFDLIIGNAAIEKEFSTYGVPFFSCNKTIEISCKGGIRNIVKRKQGSIIVLSSGSKGKPKMEKRKVAAIKFLYPLIDIINKLNLQDSKSVLISVPIIHGYGLAALLLSFFMGQRIYLSKKFDPDNTLKLLKTGVDCWIAVPLMIQKVYSLTELRTGLVKNIISGGDVLPPSVVKITHKATSSEIYNMYGTSETGICTIATNDDLLKYPDSIGKLVKGVNAKVAYEDRNSENQIGELYVRASWSADNKSRDYWPTGDLVSLNKEGYYFYKGRKDDMMVIGGENVYPIELENAIYKNSIVKWVKAKSITDKNQRTIVHIDVVLKSKIKCKEEDLLNWISDKVPRYMIPKSITILHNEPVAKLM